MKSKHTPGPWYVNHHPYTNQPGYVLAKAGKSGDDCRDVVGVATIDLNKNALEGHRSIEERDANAALIAAAPEMLEALKLAIDPLEIYRAYGWPDRAGVISKIKEVIKKAEGGE